VKLFHAGEWGAGWCGFEAVASKVPVRRVLVSHAFGGAKLAARVELMRSLGVTDLMLDSGAFTAHTLGHPVTLPDLYATIEATAPDVYVQLDVIGDAEATRSNLERMRADGFSPVPIFTRGAPWSDLDRLLDEGETYIGLGNISLGRGTVAAMAPWLNGVFAKLRAHQVEHGGPLVRTHAFGITRSEPLLRWPFYSVDSAGVVKSSGFGCAIQENADGTITVRSVSPSRKGGSSRQAWLNPTLTDAGADGPRYVARRIYSVGVMNRLEARLTRVWSMRGVEWPEELPRAA